MGNDIRAGVTQRFFVALNYLIRSGVIRGKQTFTKRYGINRWNLNALQTGKGTITNLPIDWLVYLVRDYNVSPNWLLLGVGEMYEKPPDLSQVGWQC